MNPSPSPDPHDARPVGWLGLLPVLVGVWIMPRRWGPRVAASSWVKALAAAVAAMMMCAVLLAVAASPMFGGLGGGSYGNPYGFEDVEQVVTLRGSEWVRWPFAMLCNTLFEGTQFFGDITLAVAILAGLMGLPFLPPVILTPVLATGERTRSTYARGAKFLLWTWSAWAAPCAAVAAASFVASRWPIEDSPWMEEQIIGAVEVLAAGLWGLVWLGRIGRLNARFFDVCTAEAENARVVCGGCGYDLHGLAPEGRCPECGRGIEDSRLDARRAPSWAESGWLRRPIAYPRTALRAMIRRDFFERLSILRSRFAALRFAVWSAVSTGLLAMVTAALFLVFDRLLQTRGGWDGLLLAGLEMRDRLLSGDNPIMLVLTGTLTTGGVLGVTLAVAWACSAFGFRDGRRAGTTVCYATAAAPVLLLAFSVWLAMTIVLSQTLLEEDVPDWNLAENWAINPDLIVHSATFLAMVAPVIGVAIFRFRDALRAVRFANS
ncbi:MAG: hypothetical protein IT449_07850 [Phycisphaerales bacterium]|nr:hypothetical protein [Phycisphaerales bacterium]